LEACGFRDAYSKIKKAGVTVLGISADSPAGQLKFKQNYDLPYTLLSDPDKKVAEAFEVLKEKNMYGKKVKGIARTTFLIDGDGRIARIFENLKPEEHAQQVLAALHKDGKK
jgi:thioredoxin-dependent peroxiredoxin